MSIAKPAVYLSLSGLLLFASACSGPRRPRVDASVDPINRDASVAVPCDFGRSDSGACNGATQLEVDFCDRAWAEVTPEPGILGQVVLVRARAKESERNGLSVAWMAEPDGKFGNAEATSTTYHCESLGRKMLHMASIDGRGCVTDVDFELNCVPATTAAKLDAGSL